MLYESWQMLRVFFFSVAFKSVGFVVAYVSFVSCAVAMD